MSMPPPGPPGQNDPQGGAVPPGYNPPPGFPPPGDGGFAQPPPGGGYTPPGGGGYTPPGGGGYQPPGGGFNAPGGFGTPAFGATPGPLAEWPQRALGGLIDFVAPSIVVFIVFRISFILGMLFWLGSLGWYFYNAYMNGQTGQSIGKQVVGLKVIGEQTGQPIGGGMGIVRALAHIVDGIICYIGYLFPLWDAKKQTLADKIMKTVVITVPK